MLAAGKQAEGFGVSEVACMFEVVDMQVVCTQVEAVVEEQVLRLLWIL